MLYLYYNNTEHVNCYCLKGYANKTTRGRVFTETP